jgi:uncharacterized membrane protein YccF (DUF307 family)
MEIEEKLFWTALKSKKKNSPLDQFSWGCSFLSFILGQFWFGCKWSGRVKLVQIIIIFFIFFIWYDSICLKSSQYIFNPIRTEPIKEKEEMKNLN